MGQTNGRDGGPGRKRGAGAGGPGVRTAGFSDALVGRPDRHGGSSGNNAAGPDEYMTPSSSSHDAATASGLGSRQELDGQRGNRSDDPPVRKIPVVVRYRDTNVKSLLEGSVKVQVLTQSDNWKPIAMSASEDNYFAIVELPIGDQRFKFLVQGDEVLDSQQPMIRDDNPCNIMTVNEAILSKEDEDLADDSTGWGQEQTAFDETRKYPPILPPHLRYTPLNTPPTQVRCTADGSMTVAQESSVLDAENLPLPLSVTINHVYFQRRDDHTVVGVTTRYCNKFTTLVYYKGVGAGSKSGPAGTEKGDEKK